ncbi:MAG: hypothetical protein LBS35_08615 [Synergistaceae bacterium]|jgi:hypothetical protein|nr:hypothetical protein [Synergistaceae bacterium]
MSDSGVTVVSGCGEGTARGGSIVFRRDENSDWLVGVPPVPTRVPRERRILFLMEPPMINEYELRFIRQFGVVVSPYSIEGYTGRIVLDNPCLGWSAGLNPSDNFEDCPKTKEISVVSSLKKKRYGHRKRVVFLHELMKRYGKRMDYFGRDFAPVKNKFDAIAPYKYHIAIENCNLVNYWTEKLTDAWMAWSLPIYCGDPSILRKVPDPMGIEVIDISDVPSSMRHIDYILKEDIYSSRRDAIAMCREWAVKKSNIAERVCEIIESAHASVKNIPKLETGEIVHDWNEHRHTLAGEIEGAVSWCLGAMAVWKVKRAYGKIIGDTRGGSEVK